MNHRKLISGTLTVALLATQLTPALALSATNFKDYHPTAWYSQAIDYAISNDIMRGNNSGLLNADRNITRAEFISMINRLFGTYQKADISVFADVKSSEWFFDDLAMGIRMGIVSGTSATTISPNDNLTREMAMTILARALALENTDSNVLSKYSDSNEISDWAKSSAAVFVEQGRIKGYSDNTLRPKQFITRAETAQLLMNCFENITSQTNLEKIDSDSIYLVRSKSDTTISNSQFKDMLVVANGLADSNVYLKHSDIKRLLCWGGKDIWIDSDCSVDEIIISRTDGPCTIHWLGDSDKMPKVVIRDSANDDCKVVDKNNKQLYPKSDDNSGGVGGNITGGSHGSRNVVYFDPQNGQGTTSAQIDENGLVQPVIEPTKDGFVFGGWYKEKECDSRFVFTNKVTAGMTLYAKWYTDDEWKIVEDMNQQVSNSTAHIQADTDLLAVVGEKSIPCNIHSSTDNDAVVKIVVVIKDTGKVIATVNDVKPGDMVTNIPIVDEMPAYGNYSVELVVTPVDGGSQYRIDAMLYVAYAWK